MEGSGAAQDWARRHTASVHSKTVAQVLREAKGHLWSAQGLRQIHMAATVQVPTIMMHCRAKMPHAVM